MKFMRQLVKMIRPHRCNNFTVTLGSGRKKLLFIANIFSIGLLTKKCCDEPHRIELVVIKQGCAEDAGFSRLKSSTPVIAITRISSAIPACSIGHNGDKAGDTAIARVEHLRLVARVVAVCRVNGIPFYNGE